MKASRITSQGAALLVDEESANEQVEFKFVDESGFYRNQQLPNAMSVDVEDYFQVSAFEGRIARDQWDSMPQRLPRNIARVLEIFEQRGVKATFFTLGWVCQKFPELIREIVAGGHELASHGHDHRRIWAIGAEKFARDVADTRKRLEDTGGAEVLGYRAPSFSIDARSMWAYDALREAGYRYSSSVFPIRHDHYGIPDAPRFPFRVVPADMLEIPMSSMSFMGRNWPCSGGGYFRLMPLAYSTWATRRINSEDGMPTMFYFHPWELDPEQPRIEGVSTKARIRHYLNLRRFEPRLKALLGKFRWARVDEVFLKSR
jgi:polysaccharide deacetylase family protein (PEP-CTERM system associated)